MSKQAIHELATATQQGKMTFPQVVKGLLEAGVESYLVDFATKQKTHYLANGTTHTVPLILDPGPIAEDLTVPSWWRPFAAPRRTRYGTPSL